MTLVERGPVTKRGRRFARSAARGGVGLGDVRASSPKWWELHTRLLDSSTVRAQDS